MKHRGLKIRLMLALGLVLLLALPATTAAQEPEDPLGSGDAAPPEPPPVAVEEAEPVNQVDPATLTCSDVIDFDGLSEGNYDGVIDLEGASFAERFAGQSLTYSGDFDVLSGVSSDPLTLQVGEANKNIHILHSGYPSILNGLGPLGFPNMDAIGEGAIAALFDTDQSELGFQIVGVDGGGSVTVSFFRSDGSLIQTSVFPGANGVFAFRRSGNVKDIAGISIHNSDPAGIAYDDFVICLNQPPVADPNGPYYGDEGSPVTFDGTGSSDPDGDPLTYSWSVNSALCTFDDASSPTPELTCTDNGDFIVTLVVDDGLATDSDTADVAVNNVAPTATFNAPTYVVAGDDFELSLTDPFDPSPVDTAAGFTYEFDCGDGAGYITTAGLLGSSQSGQLFTIDPSTGAATLVGYMSGHLATEIEYDSLTGQLYAEEVDGYSLLHTVDPNTGVSTGSVHHTYGALNGLEFVGPTLYGTFIPPFASTLVIVDTTNGSLVPVGGTGFGPISGLAYDASAGVMYGITAGGAPSVLVTIDLNTGAATAIGPTGFDHIGSIEFGPDGYLYGGLAQHASSFANHLVKIDTATGSATIVGDTTFSITGLTFVPDNSASCSTSSDEVGDRTVKGKIRDKDGGETEYSATVTILPPSAATDSALCYYDRKPDIDGQQFGLIFTPDMQRWPAYKLPASNPGQFFYNVFYTGAGPADFTITLPERFETQGANPVHVYTGVSVVEIGGFKCFVPDLDSEIYSGDLSGLSGLSDPGGFLYVTVHLDYGLKGTTGYIPSFNKDALDAADEVTVLIPNLGDHTFSVSGDQNDSQTIQNLNDFKKIPGFGGLVTDNVGDPVAGATVVITLEGEELGQATTDEDGWYMFVYKHTGKPADYTVELKSSTLSESGTLKANKFAEVNFITE